MQQLADISNHRDINPGSCRYVLKSMLSVGQVQVTYTARKHFNIPECAVRVRAYSLGSLQLQEKLTPATFPRGFGLRHVRYR